MPIAFPGLNNEGRQIPLITILGVLNAYPQATLEFIVRNFSTIEPPLDEAKGLRFSAKLTVYLPEDKVAIDRGQVPIVWSDRVNLSRILPPQAMDILRRRRIEKTGAIPAQAFLDHAQEIADMMRRTIVITHQYGGNMEYACYDEYEPFVPGCNGPVALKRHIPSDM
jgi:hypothetical protein